MLASAVHLAPEATWTLTIPVPATQRETLHRFHSARSRGGRLAMVDFERIPAASRSWVLDHVR